MKNRRSLAEAAGRWSASHRWAAVLLWLTFVVAATVTGSAVGTAAPTPAELTNGEARRAEEILERAGFELPAHEVVLLQSESTTVDDPGFRAAVTDTVRALRDSGRTQNIVSPLDPAGRPAVSADRRSALVQFDMRSATVTAKEEVQPVLDAVDRIGRAHPGLRVEQFGEASFQHGYDTKLHEDYTEAENLSFPVTLVILLLAFGAFVAALLPVVLALTAVVAAGGLLALTSQIAHVDQNGTSVMSLIGIAVGVDYSLFYIRRFREERARGQEAQAAVAAAAATSGHSVVVSGLTVIVSLAGLFLSGNGIFVGMAGATIVVVATAVLGSVTVLPALLSLLGDRVNTGRLPRLRRRTKSQDPAPGAGTTGPAAPASPRTGRGWNALLRGVLKRPLVAVAVFGGLLTALLLPAFSLHTGEPGVSDLPTRALPALGTYERIQHAFPGSATPAKVVVHSTDLGGPETRAALDRFRTAAENTPGLHGPVTFRTGGDGTVAIVTVGLAGTGTDEASVRALGTLRATVVPATFGAVRGADVAVGGTTAASVDSGEHLSDATGRVAGFVLVFTFLVMLFSFRSPAIAAVTLVLNLLSVGAAYGVVVLVFQHGWGEGLLDFTSTGAIASWVPLFLFVFLFGLSMDYHVFVVSRIREGHDRGLSTDRAIEEGVTGTAGAVTGAAVVMVAVAAVFGTLPQLSMKESGVGMSVAVLLDATVIRVVLLPAALKLLGDRIWRTPRLLRRTPAPHPAGPATAAADAERSAHDDRRPVTTGA
ncbi:MMPL family transporter [Streptomyces sp. NRRL S-87]|uniref:MMPL family transporter n=1 Tax=Streptomyces sp. NRRL S-87 TaxID=1463920 RepID=UPI000690D420|nr:MMPL family transporter [Streptomyces sp. NRRL S-87]